MWVFLYPLTLLVSGPFLICRLLFFSSDEFVALFTSFPYFVSFLYYVLNFLPWSLFWNIYYLIFFVYQTSYFLDFLLHPFFLDISLTLSSKFLFSFVFCFQIFNFKELFPPFLIRVSTSRIQCLLWTIITTFVFSPYSLRWLRTFIFLRDFFFLVCPFFGHHPSWWWLFGHYPNVWWPLIPYCWWKQTMGSFLYMGEALWLAFLKGNKVANCL